VPGRPVGEPPLTEGNVQGMTVDYRTLTREYLERCGWDVYTTIPSEQALRDLGMEFLIADSRVGRAGGLVCPACVRCEFVTRRVGFGLPASFYDPRKCPTCCIHRLPLLSTWYGSPS